MSKSITILDSHRRNAENVVADIWEHLEGGRDVILNLGEAAPPERVLKLLHAAVVGYEVDVTVRHAELSEYIQNSATGAAVGAGIGVAAVVAPAVLAGGPVTLTALLISSGLGALAGAIVGAGVTPLSAVKIYKVRGQTRMKFSY